MKILESHELVNTFIKKYIDATRIKGSFLGKIIGSLIAGKILLPRSSPNKIQRDLVTGEAKATFYRDIHRLAERMPMFYQELLAAVQTDPKLAMRQDGIYIIDEHIMEHSSKGIEGVDWYYAPSKRKKILGMSAITVHYYRQGVEYPVDFRFYRREEEMLAHDVADQFKEKNEIFRELVATVSQLPGAPSLIVMDSFFMTKENVTLLKKLGMSYVSRPKRNWNVDYERVKYTMDELFESIPQDEFQETCYVNPKTGEEKKYTTAMRKVFIPKIGFHLALFVDCTKPRPENKEEDDTEAVTTATGRRYRVFVASNLEWDAAMILSIYAERWAIETSYEDMNQDLNLHGCKWRELNGQQCFVSLTFSCYLFLMWAKIHGFLTENGVNPTTIGQLKEGFETYCQYEFVEYIKELKQQCETCSVMNFIFYHMHGGFKMKPTKLGGLS